MRAGNSFEVFEATKSPIADEALARIRALYTIEAEIRGDSAERRQAVRRARAQPLLAALHAWGDAGRARPPLGARSSMRSVDGRRWAATPRLSIDNNLSERLLRGIAVSRKNFLFVGSDLGGERAAAIYTLIESAQLNGLNPEAYLAMVLSRMALGHHPNRLVALLQWVVAMPTSDRAAAA